MEDLPVVRNEIFEESDWEATKAQVLRKLRDLGHARAQLDGQAVVDVGTKLANLHIRTAPGRPLPLRRHRGAHRCRPGDTGAAAQAPGGVDPHWVGEQVRLAIGHDRTYSESAMEEAQRRVFDMGVFSTVRITADGEPTPDGRIPVVAHVRQGPMHSLRLGGGVGFDQVRQEVRLMAEWTNRDFLGGMRRLQLRGMFGWAFLPSTPSRSFATRSTRAPHHGPIYRAGANFDQPRLFGRPSLTPHQSAGERAHAGADLRRDRRARPWSASAGSRTAR